MRLEIRCPDCGGDDVQRTRTLLIQEVSTGFIVADFGAPFLEANDGELGETLDHADDIEWRCHGCGRVSLEENGEDFIHANESEPNA